ncbi:MAG: PP2C family protein-serine/threonine phosphatase [Ktedonobacterales bacterium]
MALLGVLALLAIAAQPVPARAASVATATRPPQSVAYSRIALVRVLTYYNGTVKSDNVPIPVLSPCASDGVLVGTTGSGLNSFSYVLTPTAAVNPFTPCQGVQAAFQQISGTASSWSIGHIDVLLNVAYTGTGDTQIGTLRYTIDPAQLTTNGGPAAPKLQLLALSVPQGSPSHDLPVLSVPQPSDAPADPAASVLLDLTTFSGQPSSRDFVTSDQVKATLYPISLPAPQQATPTATTTRASGTTTPATQAPTATPPTTTPDVSASVGIGAPLIDGNGRLIGMVVPDSRGNHTIASLDAVTHAIGPVNSQPGALMSAWQQGVASYYATPPQFSQAATSFTTLAQSYPDFGGVTPFKAAAQQSSTTIPALTRENAQPGGQQNSTTPLLSTRNIIILAAIIVLLALLITVAAVVLLQRRRKVSTASGYVVPPDEAMLDLLPRDLPLDAIPPLAPAAPMASGIENEQTRPLAAVTGAPAPSADLDAIATIKMPAQHQRLPRVRQGMALMPHAAGRTDPGVKRASDPNQDNILAVQGIRLTSGRVQPYGLFIVADGMGGHLNGREASRFTIEIVASSILQMLNTSLPLDDTALTNLLRDSLLKAAAELRRRNVSERLDMGTTVTAALVVDDIVYVANVGDSRTYVMSPETGLRQITMDHSVVASLVSAGVIRPEDIYRHPRRNQIYRSLGGEQENVEVDTFEVGLQAGDKLLLCSDGLWEMVRDPQIEHILRATADPQLAVDLLVREANSNGGEDNISAVVVRLLEDVPQTAEPGMRVVVAPQSASTAPPLPENLPGVYSPPTA